jgi:hypothetical protein
MTDPRNDNPPDSGSEPITRGGSPDDGPGRGVGDRTGRGVGDRTGRGVGDRTGRDTDDRPVPDPEPPEGGSKEDH